MSLFASVSFLSCFWADVEKVALSFSCAFFSRSYPLCFSLLLPAPSVLPASLSFLFHEASSPFLFCAACARAPAVEAPPAYARRLSRRRAVLRTSPVCLRNCRVPCVSVGALLLASRVSALPVLCVLVATTTSVACRCRGVIFLFASGGPVIVSSLPSPSSAWCPTDGSSVLVVLRPSSAR